MTCTRICFLGNSHTFYHGLAYQVQALARARGSELVVEAHAAGGQGLDWHRNQPASVQSVTLKSWDAVVLQHSAHPFPGEESLRAAYAWWVPVVRASGAKPWMSMVWPERARPQDEALRDGAYRRVAATCGLPTIPIQAAWMAVRRSRSDIDLYDGDGEHAGPAGTYLAACTVLAAVCGIAPAGLPGRVAVRGQVLADLDARTASILQEAAMAAVGQTSA